MSLPDIPRLYTALAEWLACTMYLLALRPRFGRAATLLCSAAWLAGLGIFLQRFRSPELSGRRSFCS